MKSDEGAPVGRAAPAAQGHRDEYAVAEKIVRVWLGLVVGPTPETVPGSGWATSGLLAEIALELQRERTAVLCDLAEMFHDLSENKRLAEMEEWRRDARRYRSQGDMYGWNFYEGMAAGANATDILYQRLGRVLRQRAATASEARRAPGAPTNTQTTEGGGA